MAPRKAPRKSLFGSQKGYFPDFPFRGSVGGRPVRKAWSFGMSRTLSPLRHTDGRCPLAGTAHWFFVGTVLCSYDSHYQIVLQVTPVLESA